MGDSRTVNHTIAARLQALTLVEHGVGIDAAATASGMTSITVRCLRKKARERGFDPEVSSVMKEEYFKDAPRSGRPPKVTSEVEYDILTTVRKDANGREKPAAVLAYEHNVSATAILRVLKRNRLRWRKTTKKPGLTLAMMEARYQFALRHEHWTIEDWKKVIWTDETSVCLGTRRACIRVWRDSTESYNKTCVHRRWKGYSEFMSWGSFSYDKKGAMHNWKDETAAEKKAAIEHLKRLNDIAESAVKEEMRINQRNKTNGTTKSWRSKAHLDMEQSSR